MSNERDPELTKAKTELENTINELKDVLTKLKPENANFVISFLTPPKKTKTNHPNAALGRRNHHRTPYSNNNLEFSYINPIPFPLIMINLTK